MEEIVVDPSLVWLKVCRGFFLKNFIFLSHKKKSWLIGKLLAYRKSLMVIVYK